MGNLKGHVSGVGHLAADAPASSRVVPIREDILIIDIPEIRAAEGEGKRIRTTDKYPEGLDEAIAAAKEAARLREEKAGASASEISNNGKMDNPVSRDEMNAKFDAINANMQAHEARIDTRIGRLETLIERSIEDSRQAVVRVEALGLDVIKEAKETRRHATNTALALLALVAAILAIATSWQQTALSNNNTWIQRELSSIQDSLKDIKQAQIAAKPVASPPADQTPAKH